MLIRKFTKILMHLEEKLKQKQEQEERRKKRRPFSVEERRYLATVNEVFNSINKHIDEAQYFSVFLKHFAQELAQNTTYSAQLALILSDYIISQNLNDTLSEHELYNLVGTYAGIDLEHKLNVGKVWYEFIAKNNTKLKEYIDCKA